MILSDRTIREELAAGRIEIDPLDETCIQPSSVDLHLDRYFRVFRNHTTRVIDVKDNQEDLTELVEVKEDEEPFILHPGEFVLGSTIERVSLPTDLVGRLEGKSSLGRLGLLIHSSLPADEEILFLDASGLRRRRIDEIVRKELEGAVVGYDPETFETAYFPVTGWYEGPPDRIFDVRLRSGRSVRVTAGHALFGLTRDGEMRKLRAQELVAGDLVAIPKEIPDLPAPAAEYDLRALMPEAGYGRFVVEGPTVKHADWDQLHGLLRDCGWRHAGWYRSRGQLPVAVARRFPEVWDALGSQDRLRPRGARSALPVRWTVDEDLAWLVGFFVAEGYRRANQVVFSNTDPTLLDRVESILRGRGLPVYRRDGVAVTCGSSMLSAFLGWIGTGGKAGTKRIPADALGWPAHLLGALLDGLLDGDGTHSDARRCYFSSSPGLVGDLLTLAPRLGLRATASFRARARLGLYQVSIPVREHKLLTSVPLPDRLLVAVREACGMTQTAAAAAAGYRHATDLCNIEHRAGRDALRPRTLRRLVAAYRRQGAPEVLLERLERLVTGGVGWDRVDEVVDTGRVEPVYDLEVRPEGRKVENFVAGRGGVFVSNTAGFVDAGWNGQLTLELSNVANLPITLYPGMKIGQISFMRMTTEAEHPYGSGEVGSKYQHQVGPRPSRYYENWR